MKQRFITIMALAAIVSLAGCQREQAPAGGERVLDIALEMEDIGISPATKVDVNGNTGVCTWTAGDHIGVMLTDANGNGYYDLPVNTTYSTIQLSMSPEMSLSGYSVSPYLMCDTSDPAPTGATPRVHYLASYSMDGLDLSKQTFSYIPMMAINNVETPVNSAYTLRFYQVGGLLRLVMSNVPEGTNKIEVEFVGISDVCGICTVTKPGTVKATTAVTTGEGNTVTFTDVTRIAGTMYLNVPLPTLDFSGLTAIHIYAYDGSTLKGTATRNNGASWGLVKHGYGRMLDADFSAEPLSGVRLSSEADITLWKSKTVQRTAVAVDAYGLDTDEVTMVWSSSVPSVATVDASTGLVTAVGPGETTITATATATVGGTPRSNSYTVYVNAVTGISVTPDSYSVAPGGKTAVTATLTITGNGTTVSYPSDLVVSWTSSDTDHVTVTPGSVLPMKVDATTAAATVSVNGVAGGASTLTATVADTYSSTGSTLSKTVNITCE